MSTNFKKGNHMYNLNTIITFGKYKDSVIERILNHDPSYIIWLSTIKDVNSEVLELAERKNIERIQNKHLRKQQYLNGNYNDNKAYDSAFASCFDWGSQ